MIPVIEILVTDTTLEKTIVYQYLALNPTNQDKDLLEKQALKYCENLNLVADLYIVFNVGNFVNNLENICYNYLNMPQEDIREFVLEWTVSNQINQYVLNPFAKWAKPTNHFNIIGNDSSKILATLQSAYFNNKLDTLIETLWSKNKDLLMPMSHCTHFIRHIVITQIAYLQNLINRYTTGRYILPHEVTDIQYITGMNFGKFMEYVNEHSTR